MAKQMMEDSLTWAGCDVNRAWGEGCHNQKHSSQTFPDVLRWLSRNWLATLEIKANPKGESKCKGQEEVEKGEWEKESLACDGWDQACRHRLGALLYEQSDAEREVVQRDAGA